MVTPSAITMLMTSSTAARREEGEGGREKEGGGWDGTGGRRREGGGGKSRGLNCSDRPIQGWGAAEPQPTAHGHGETWGESERTGVRQTRTPASARAHTHTDAHTPKYTQGNK